ncbi:hypothetical protein M9Y10_034920 [Tritrichomonas musculus]|uniref:SAC3/GANP/THP3 conserved domain-containing protein n=1 Tax=Tritrichomonas musculus TaxID=1915356 RepID=A0ABR2KGB3_9EUKA
MEDDITYTSKANRNTAQMKVVAMFSNSKKESKPSTTIPNAFLRKVHFMEKYPQSLRDYIKKCFAQCTDDKSREIVSTKLINTINSVSGQGNLNQHNWNTHPLVTPVEKEPTPPPPPPPPPKESFNQFQNRPIQAFSSNFLNQQPLHQMQQRQPPYGYQLPVQQSYGNYQYGQPHPNQLVPPPPPQSLLQTNFQSNNGNYQYNNDNNFNQPYQQVKNTSYFQNQGRLSAQNSYQNYEYNPQNNQLVNSQYQNFQKKPKNAIFNSNVSNFNDANLPKNQEFASYAPGQNVPKVQQTQNVPPSQSSFSSQFNAVTANKNNFNINNQPNFNNTGSNIDSNEQEFQVKGKKKKKNKKGKFNQQQNQFTNNFDASVSSPTPSAATSISSSRQRISQLEEEGNRALVGTSTSLEKEYLRLAGDQVLDSSMFRPLPVLKESLQYCLSKFNKNKDYEYISEQLRSIRQDLTVQHIEDVFNVTVYETHAKLAIQNNDWGNFNQSMGPLEILYSKKLGSFENICEFWMYRIIYLFGVDDIDGLCSFIPRINHNVFISKDVQFAIKVWKIAQSGEWMKYFSIMKKSNPFIKSVMTLKAQSLRITALSCLCRAFRNLSLKDYRTFLCYNEDEDDLLRKFLDEYDIPIPEK